MLQRNKLFSLFCFLGLVVFLELIGGYFTNLSVNEWYLTLKKPNFTPPSYVFSFVWTVLYIMIGIAGWRIFHIANKKRVFLFYILQLLCNLLWTFFFFFLKSPLLGLMDIVFLLIFLFLNIKDFYKIDKASGILLTPYFIWSIYAAILNFSIWSLNF